MAKEGQIIQSLSMVIQIFQKRVELREITKFLLHEFKLVWEHCKWDSSKAVHQAAKVQCGLWALGQRGVALIDLQSTSRPIYSKSSVLLEC